MTSRSSGASTCSTTAARASPSSSTPRTAGAGRRRSPACRSRSASSVKHDGVLYRKLYDYTGKVTYVLGEFYWQLDARPAHLQQRLPRHRRGVGEAPEPRADRARAARARSSGRPARRSPPTRWSRPSASRPTSAPRCSAMRCRRRSSAVAARQDLLLDLHHRRRADAVPLRQRRRPRRLQRAAQHLRRRVAGVPELPEQPEQRQRLAHRRRLVRRLLERRRATSSAKAHVRVHHRSIFAGELHGRLDWLKPAVFFGSILYALIGVRSSGSASSSSTRSRRIDLWDEIVEKKNVALAIVVGSMCIAIGLIVAAAVHG